MAKQKRIVIQTLLDNTVNIYDPERPTGKVYNYTPGFVGNEVQNQQIVEMKRGWVPTTIKKQMAMLPALDSIIAFLNHVCDLDDTDVVRVFKDQMEKANKGELQTELSTEEDMHILVLQQPASAKFAAIISVNGTVDESNNNHDIEVMHVNAGNIGVVVADVLELNWHSPDELKATLNALSGKLPSIKWLSDFNDFLGAL